MVDIETNRIYRPAISRQLFTFVGLPVLAVLVGWGSRLLIDFFVHDVGNLGRQVDFVTITILVYAVLNSIFWLVNKNEFEITINSISISGPSRLGIVSDLKTFPIDKLDTDRLFQRTFWEIFWHQKDIWSKDKDKIVISRFLYSPEQEREIIQILFSRAKEIQGRKT